MSTEDNIIIEDNGPISSSGVSGEISFFSDKEEVLVAINEICSNKWEIIFEKKFDWLQLVLGRYQEQPTLLGSSIQELITPMTDKMLDIVSTIDTQSKGEFQKLDTPQLHAICKVIQLICRVRGFKHVNKVLPHEVSHLEICLFLLRSQDRADYDTWQTRYVLLLWLNILCLIPFDICSLDSSLSTKTTTAVQGHIAFETEQNKSKLVSHIIDTCTSYLSDPGSPREVASTCLSSLLTRPDMEKNILSNFMNWCQGVIHSWTKKGDDAENELTRDSFQIIGVMHCIAKIFKTGDRGRILHHASETLSPCLLIASQMNQTVTRKLTTKLFQRIGMLFLPPRLASWRYQRGQRSLCDNLQSDSSNVVVLDSNGSKSETNDEDDDEVPVELEDIIEQLLNSLNDKDTVVRWSAAKGIGRITMRLPRGLGDDVVGGVLEMFTDPDADSSWHGGCLALAELARRGLLLPERLDETVPIIEKAINFDILRGQHSVGAHVRDAACYVCWAFARAYAPSVMKPFMASLSCTMLITALYDREVNCRRAASAAFQENVGRQGNESFEHGIEIITIADYFSLGVRSHAYLEIAPSIAIFTNEICIALQNHLRNDKLVHWDEEIRVLASKGLARLAHINKDNTILLLRSIVADGLSTNFARRHGSLLGVAEIMLGLSECAEVTDNSETFIPKDILDDIIQLIPRIDKARLYRGRGSELLRTASCLLIENMARAHLPVDIKIRVLLVEALNENIRQPYVVVQQAAANALRQFLYSYFSNTTDIPSEKLQKLTISKYLTSLTKDDNVAVTRGNALALGALPVRLLTLPEGRLDEILDACLESSCPSKLIAGEPDAETRKNVIESVIEIIEKLELNPRLNKKHINQSLDILIRACNDYSVDKRGDTGSWSRVAALRGMERIMYMCIRKNAIRELGLLPPSPPEINSDNKNSLVGSTVVTSFGIGTIELDIENKSCLVVSVPNKSLGCFYSQKELSSYLASIENIEKISNNKSLVLINIHRKGARLLSNVNQDQICDDYDDILTEEMWINITSAILKQLSEKLDAVRDAAGNIIERLLILPPTSYLNKMPYRDELCKYIIKVQDLINIPSSSVKVGVSIKSDEIKPIEIVRNSHRKINWSQPLHVFPFVINSLNCPCYFQSIIAGLIVSIGGLTETVVKASTSSLLQFCHNKKSIKNHTILSNFANCLINIFETNRSNDRVVIPLLKTIEILLRNSIFDFLRSYENSFPLELLFNVKEEMKSSNDIGKLRACIDVLLLLLLFEDPVRHSAVKELVILLGHKYPRIRTYSSEVLYLQFLADSNSVGISGTEMEALIETHKINNTVNEDANFFSGLVTNQENLDKAQTLLSTCSWDGPIPIARKNRLCMYFNIIIYYF
jgi:hypothetical protein